MGWMAVFTGTPGPPFLRSTAGSSRCTGVQLLAPRSGKISQNLPCREVQHGKCSDRVSGKDAVMTDFSLPGPVRLRRRAHTPSR